MDTLLKDLRFGARSLLRQRTFTSVVVLTLALGIGANTTIFSVINALILTPPAISEPERVVALWETPVDTRREGFLSYLNLLDWQSRNQTFEQIAGYKPNGFVLLENGEAEPVQGMRITANFLPLLKVNPIRGRNFEPDEENDGGYRYIVKVLSDEHLTEQMLESALRELRIFQKKYKDLKEIVQLSPVFDAIEEAVR